MAMFSLNSLPLGYRFRPKDKDLVDYYLRGMINGNEEVTQVIGPIDICKHEPWDLPGFSVLDTRKYKEWFFFHPLSHKYRSGQRLKRTTKEGFWKSTGADRTIIKRKREIGKRKTLVFYIGRAPDGKKTNWVIHEYRTTLKDLLNGTHPTQGAFVLCRLFKQKDKKIKGSDCNEVESAVSSPTTTRSPSPEDTQSQLALDQETPALGREAEKQTTYSDCCQAEDFERTPETLVPAECHSYGHNDNDEDNQVAQVTATEVDPPWEENVFYDPIMELNWDLQMEAELGSFYLQDPGSNDFNNSHCGLQLQNGLNDADDRVAEVTATEVDLHPILQPNDWHSQIQTEPGSSYKQNPSPNDLCNCHSGLHLENGTNECDAFMSNFLDSVLTNPDGDYFVEPVSQKNWAIVSEVPKNVTTVSQNLVSVNDSEPSNEADHLEVAQSQLDPELVADGCSKEKENVARMGYFQGETTPEGYRTQISDNNNDYHRGTLDFLQIGSPRQGTSTAGSNWDLVIEESSSHTNADRSGNIIGTENRVKHRQPQTQPSTPNILNQGTAPRRIRLQTKLKVGLLDPLEMSSRLSFGSEDHEPKSTVTEEEKGTEEHTAGAAHATTVDGPEKICLPESEQEATLNMGLKLRSKSNVSKGGDKKVPSVFLKMTAARHSVLSSVFVLRIVAVIVICIVQYFCWVKEMPNS